MPYDVCTRVPGQAIDELLPYLHTVRYDLVLGPGQMSNTN